MFGDFNPGTSHGRDSFAKKKQGLADDKKFKTTTKDVGTIHKYLVGKQPSLGKVATRIQVRCNDTGSPTNFENLIQQHKSVPFQRPQCLAHAKFTSVLHEDQCIPTGP